jgi:hypothetical protein
MAVINFAVLAGGSRWSGFFAHRIFPVDASMTTAAREPLILAKEVEREKDRVATEKARTYKKVPTNLPRLIRFFNLHPMVFASCLSEGIADFLKVY